jgi:hypothetical protein
MLGVHAGELTQIASRSPRENLRFPRSASTEFLYPSPNCDFQLEADMSGKVNPHMNEGAFLYCKRLLHRLPLNLQLKLIDVLYSLKSDREVAKELLDLATKNRKSAGLLKQMAVQFSSSKRTKGRTVKNDPVLKGVWARFIPKPDPWKRKAQGWKGVGLSNI